MGDKIYHTSVRAALEDGWARAWMGVHNRIYGEKWDTGKRCYRCYVLNPSRPAEKRAKKGSSIASAIVSIRNN